MPKITISEIDETTVLANAATTDIAFVPGFADTNSNVYIYTVADAEPTNATLGTVATSTATYHDHPASGEYPMFVVNTLDKKCWKCTAVSGSVYTWTEQDTYLAPAPENEIVLCNTLAEFVANFGATPYQFPNAASYPTFTTASSMGYKVGDYEKSYIYAKELVANGVPVQYVNIVSRASGLKSGVGTNDITELYETLPTYLEALQDRGDYEVKYITSGAYPTFEYTETRTTTTGTTTVVNGLAKEMLETAYIRGDAVAIIDHTDIYTRVLTGDGSVFKAISDANFDDGDYTDAELRKFGTMFTPYASYTCTATKISGQPITNVILPASYGYLRALASSIKNYANYSAVAGVTRGTVPNITALHIANKMSNKIASETFQPRDDVAINAITEIRPYGLTLWGNRTLDLNSAGNLTASSFLNIRNLVSEVKKQAYITANSLQFEPDTETLWLNFMAGISPLLDSMISGQGLKGYRFIRGTSSERAKVVATIKLQPTYAVEDFDITVVLTDDDVSVS